MTEEDARAAAAIYARNRTGGGKESLVDRTLLAMARRIGASLLTTDNDRRGEKGGVILDRE